MIRNSSEIVDVRKNEKLDIKKKKYLVLGYYGAGNAGDDMMLYCILDWMAKQSISSIVISESPQDTEKRFKVNAVKNVPLLGQWGWPKVLFNGRLINLIKTISSCEGLVVGGGDLIRDDGGLKMFFYTIEKILLAILFGKKIFLINVGIGIPEKLLSKVVLNYVLKRARLIVVRDIRSYEFCLNNKFKNIYKSPDIVFMLPSLLGTFEKKEISPTIEKYFIVTLRGSAGGYKMIDFNEDLCVKFASVIDELTRVRNLRCLFVPFQCSKLANDNSLHNQVYKHLNNNKSAIILEWSENLEQLVSIYSKAEFVIGMRLHALILGLALGKKCIAIPYDIKCLELCKMHQIRGLLDCESLKSKERILQIINTTLNSNFVVNINKHLWPEMNII